MKKKLLLPALLIMFIGLAGVRAQTQVNCMNVNLNPSGINKFAVTNVQKITFPSGKMQVDLKNPRTSTEYNRSNVKTITFGLGVPDGQKSKEITSLIQKSRIVNTNGSITYVITRNYDDASKDDTTITLTPVSFMNAPAGGGRIDKNNTNFGTASITNGQAVQNSSNTSGNVTSVLWDQAITSNYNGVSHVFNTRYTTFVYSEGGKSVSLTTNTWQLTAGNVQLGTATRITENGNLYDLYPVTFNYTGKYENSTNPYAVSENLYVYVGEVTKTITSVIQKSRKDNNDGSITYVVTRGYSDYSTSDTTFTLTPVSFMNAPTGERIDKNDTNFGIASIVNGNAVQNSSSTSGNVTSTLWDQVITSNYNGVSHIFNGRYTTFAYYEGGKSVTLTTDTWQLTPGNIQLGTPSRITEGSSIYDWYSVTFNYTGKYENSTNPYTVSGNLYVYIRDTGLDEVKSQSLVAYPSVFSDGFTLKADEVIGKVYIYTVYGQPVMNMMINTTESTVNMGSYPSGIYIVKAEKYTVKVIKK